MRFKRMLGGKRVTVKDAVYQVITDRMIGLLEAGTVPWRKPWNSEAGFPKNLVSKKEYRGVNVFLLHAASYESPYWLTYKQAVELKGNVRKGEKAMPVVFWNWLDSKTQRQKRAEKRLIERPV